MKPSLSLLKLSLIILVNLLFINTTQASKLDDLLQKVKSQQQQHRQQQSLRSADFSGDVSEWKIKLQAAQARFQRVDKAVNNKSERFQVNEEQLTELTSTLNVSKDSLGELFGVVRQASGEFLTLIDGSVTSVQYPQRNKFVRHLAEAKVLPSLNELQQLWFMMQQEMTASTQVSEFKAKVVDSAGVASEKMLTRIGAFNLLGDQQYLHINSQSQLPQPLMRAVPSPVQGSLNNWMENKNTLQPFYFDPAKGQLLTLLSRTPTWAERIQQGGSIGYLIIAILLCGVMVAMRRFFVLSKESLKIKQQLKQTTANPNNALGRVLMVYQDNKLQTTELLELKLEEAVLREIPRLERGASVLKILAAIAPMMGLLGTVTGMIGTFQSITLFGTGDPKLMAGGISMALITTVMGLIAALPLLLIHSLLHSNANTLINIIELQSAGLIAEQAEVREEVTRVTQPAYKHLNHGQEVQSNELVN